MGGIIAIAIIFIQVLAMRLLTYIQIGAKTIYFENVTFKMSSLWDKTQSVKCQLTRQSISERNIATSKQEQVQSCFRYSKHKK